MQGVRVLKDFDIKSAARGVDTPIKLKFNAPVTDKALEVRFYYTGKGTQTAPVRGKYGSLVSAISVESGNIIILRLGSFSDVVLSLMEIYLSFVYEIYCRKKKEDTLHH